MSGTRHADTAQRVVELLAGRRLAVAESCTAGKLCAEFAAVGGAADWLQGGLVAYATEVKRRMLEVTAPAVLSERAAAEMAAGVARLLDAQVAVATTGVVGETPEDGVAPGTVFFATSVDGVVWTSTRTFDGAPSDVCEEATLAALELLAAHVMTIPVPWPAT